MPIVCMSRNTTLLTTLIFFFLTTSFSKGQAYYYPEEGKSSMQFSKEKMLICFKSGTSFEKQKAIIHQFEVLLPLTKEMLLPSPRVVIAKCKVSQNRESIQGIIHKLQQFEEIQYANPFLVHPDGTLHGITDEIIIRLKSTNDIVLLQSTAALQNIEIISQNQFDSKIFHLKVIGNNRKNALEVARYLHESGKFEFAEPDFLRLMKRMNTNDPLVDTQWALENDGINTEKWDGMEGADMNVFNAWATSTGSSDIKIAVIDEGVDLNHPDLVHNLLPGFDATGQGNLGDCGGDDAHGTACAGIVAASGNNNNGISGVAYGCKIIPVRIAYTNETSWITKNSWLADGINWAWQTAGADVLSNSWGGGTVSMAIDFALNGAVEEGRGGLGTPVLFSAGNNDGAVCYPATNKNVIAVVAMNMCNQRKAPDSCDGENWWGSNYGINADVAAPGVKILTTDISGQAGFSHSDYTSNFNGTSSACPNAAGVMALILSAKPDISESNARFALESTCRKTGDYTYDSGVPNQPNGTWSLELGYGSIDAYAAVQSVAPVASNDAGIVTILSPLGNNCSDNAQPILALRNNGKFNLETAYIHVQVDEGPVYTYAWNGSLSSLQITNVVIPEIFFSPGFHVLKAFTSHPNGVDDENLANDLAESPFYFGNNVTTLALSFDDYPEETRWEIWDESQKVIVWGGPYGAQADASSYEETICLADGCYQFVIYDSYGDGICCNYGQGSFRLTEVESGEALVDAAEFAYQSTYDFCIPMASSEPFSVSISEIKHVSCFGFSDGNIKAEVSGGVSPFSFTWSDDENEAEMSGLKAGEYHLTVTDGNNEQAECMAIITEPDLLTLEIIGIDTVFEEEGYAEAFISGGTEPYFVHWSTGDTTEYIQNLPSDIYTAAVADSNGCIINDSIQIHEYPPIIVDTCDNMVVFNLRLDSYPSETNWEIKDDEGTVVAAGGPFSATSEGQTVTQTLCLSDGCYYFSIFDVWGDGICCNYGDGFYQLTDQSNGKEILSGKKFGKVETSLFCLNAQKRPDQLVFEFGKTTSVGEEWKTVQLNNQYQSMVVLASVVLPSVDSKPVVSRIKNAHNSSFDLRIQTPGNPVNDKYDIHYVVIEEGVYTQIDHGITMEAIKISSSQTADHNNWITEKQAYYNEYTTPVVLGQVMSTHDEAWSVFWASKAEDSGTPPDAESLSIGKHAGEDMHSQRVEERIGYVVIEEGSGSFSDTVSFHASIGPNTVKDPFSGNSSYPNEISNSAIAIVSSAGMNDSNGGWPVLFGETPLADDRLLLAFDEDQIKDDERIHSNEQVAYLLFGNPNDEPTSNGSEITAETGSLIAEELISIYPNPVSNQLTLEIRSSSHFQPFSLHIKDAQGKEIEQRSISFPSNGQVRKIELDVSTLPSGYYILHLQSASGTNSMPFVKN